MKTFDDLEFEQIYSKETHGREAWQAQCELGRGLELSVVYGDGNYCDYDSHGSPATYEVAVLFGRDYVPLQAFDDVLGWQTPELIDQLIIDIRSDPAYVKKRVDDKCNAGKNLG